MSRRENASLEPGGYGDIKLVELVRKKVVSAGHNDKMVVPGYGRHQAFHFFYRAVPVGASVHEELRLLR